jgi:hypothetical protein
MLKPHPLPRSPGEIDGKNGVDHNRHQKEQPNVNMVFIESDVCLIMHEAAREMKSGHTAARKKDQYAQHNIGYAEGQDDGQRRLGVKKCIQFAPRCELFAGIIPVTGRSHPNPLPYV